MNAHPSPSASLSFSFDGRIIGAVPGESLAAALLAAGELHHCTGKDGTPRGAFCGMGVCHDCLVTVDGRASQRACMTAAHEGMIVERQDTRRISFDSIIEQTEPPASIMVEEIECLVIGAGPAGLAAALKAARAGVKVVLIDERKAPGGQFFKQNITSGKPTDRQMQDGSALIADVLQAGVELRNETLVWGAFTEGEQTVITTIRYGIARILHPRYLVLATGAYEAPPLFPGWTLPGIMTTGALQTALRSYGRRPKEPVLIAGNGPLNFQVALELAEAGANVIGIVEAANPPWTRPAAGAALFRADPKLALEGLAMLARLRGKGIPIHWGHRIVAVEGQSQPEEVLIATHEQGAASTTVQARIIGHGDGFLPASELQRLLGCAHVLKPGRPYPEVRRDSDGATSRPDVFVVGEAGGFGGAHIARAQGELAGQTIARLLGKESSNTRSALISLKRHQRLQDALWTLFAAPQINLSDIHDTTILCRCEALSMATLKAIVTDHGMTDVATLKRLSRAGMGRCQARYCGHHLHALVKQEPQRETQLLTPAGSRPACSCRGAGP